MSDLSDPPVRAYLMAYAAVEVFGFTREDKKAYAARMSQIGNEQGLEAEAEAIAHDCKQHGLEMSARRVMKALAEFQKRHALRITYVPERNILVVADGYAPGEEPLQALRSLGQPRARRSVEEGPPVKPKSAAGFVIGFIAGAVAMMVSFNAYQFSDLGAVMFGVAVWIVVAVVWNKLRR
jgi:hypothetical protein